tara:strand:- start:746 stop:1129 length:384 start_codon:yes stop_codon:yes gene_type:complete
MELKITNVVAAIIKKNNHYFIAQRNRKKHMAFKWEFPGGKVNKNETFKEALSREIKEELNITIKIVKKIAQENYSDEKINIVLHYYLCNFENGLIKLNEHEDMAWVEKKDFIKYDFAKGDADIISKI